MKKSWLSLYTIISILLTALLLAFVSAWLSLRGIDIPWVNHHAGSIQIHNFAFVLPAIILGSVLSWGVHTLAQRTGNNGWYFYGWFLVVVGITVVTLLAYGGACGFCKAVTCAPYPVQDCGIQARFSLTFLQIYCKCYQPSSWLPGLLPVFI